MEKGQEPSKNTALNIFPWFNLLGSLEYKFQCRVVPLKARGLDFCACYHSIVVFGTRVA